MSDLINRQDAIDGADEIIKRDTSGNNAVVEAMKAWKAYIGNLPSAERKRGKWIQIEDVDANGNALYECPFCRKSDCHAVSQIVSYCWNCGADMKGDEDD